MIGIVGLIVLLPLALLALAFDLARFAASATLALVEAAFERRTANG